MAYNAYLKLDGITGESIERNHAGWIEILSWSWGASQPSERMATGTGAGKAGTPSFQAISIGKRIDSTSPLLIGRCLSGKVTANVYLEATQAYGMPGKLADLPIMDLKLSNVLVSAIRPSQFVVASDLSPAGQAPYGYPVETLTLNFAKFKLDWTPRKDDGSSLPLISTGWDVKGNKVG